MHRGEHEPPGLPETPHLHVNRRELVTRREELDRFRPDAPVDLAAATGPDSEAVLGAVDLTLARRLEHGRLQGVRLAVGR